MSENETVKSVTKRPPYKKPVHPPNWKEKRLEAMATAASEAVKESVAAAVKEAPSPAASAVTPEEQAIINRALKETVWPDESERETIDYSLMQDKFRFPEPCYKQMEQKKLAFRWITRTPERIDEMRTNPIPFRWAIANRVNTPFLAEFIDKTLGCVVRLDQILMYRPWWMHEEELNYDRRMAEGKDRPITSKDGEIRNNVELIASQRSGETDKRTRAEIGGAAIIAGDAEDAGSPMYEQDGGFDSFADSASP